MLVDPERRLRQQRLDERSGESEQDDADEEVRRSVARKRFAWCRLVTGGAGQRKT
jgi:hypothetical protein